MTREMCDWVNPHSKSNCEIYGTVYRDKVPVTAFISSYVSIDQFGKRWLFNLDLFPAYMIESMQKTLIQEGRPNEKIGTSTRQSFNG